MPIGAYGGGREFEVYLEFAKGGQRLDEFKLEAFPEQDGKPAQTNCWIECSLGKEFRIIIKSLAKAKRIGKKEVMAKVYIDGKTEDRCVDRLMFLDYSDAHVVDTFNVEKNGRAVTYPLTFSEVETVDEQSKAEVEPAQAAEVGSIRIELDYGSSTGDNGRSHPAPVMKELGSCYERSVKMGASVRAKGKVKRGAISKKAQSNHTSIFTPTDDDPFHIFNVKYCTRAGLDILLRGAAPKPAEVPKPRPSSTQMPATPQSIASSSAVPGPSQQRKRPRPPTPPSSISSVSSDSSPEVSDTEDAPDPTTVPTSMADFFQMYIQQQAELAEQNRKEKEAKKQRRQRKEQRRGKRKQRSEKEREGMWLI